MTRPGGAPDMQFSERFPLLASMVLQGVVTLTFGVGFYGLWRGFRRPAALVLSVAFLTYAVGVWLSVSGLMWNVTANWPLLLRGSIGLPLVVGAILFRPATDALAGRDVAAHRTVYGIALSVAVVVMLVLQGVVTRWEPGMRPYLYPYVVPRLTLGAGFLWSALPLFRLPRAERRTGYALVAWTLAALGARMFASVAFEAWHWVPGTPGVATLLNQFRTLQASSFAARAQADSAQFARPDRSVRLTSRSGAPPVALVMDSTAGGFWVRRDGDSVTYKLDTWLANQLAPADSTLRRK